MNDIKDFKDYKRARILITQLKIIIKVIDGFAVAMEPYQIYKPVNRILQIIKEEKLILAKHLKDQERIKKEKSNSNEKV